MYRTFPDSSQGHHVTNHVCTMGHVTYWERDRVPPLSTRRVQSSTLLSPSIFSHLRCPVAIFALLLPLYLLILVVAPSLPRYTRAGRQKPYVMVQRTGVPPAAHTMTVNVGTLSNALAAAIQQAADAAASSPSQVAVHPRSSSGGNQHGSGQSGGSGPSGEPSGGASVNTPQYVSG